MKKYLPIIAIILLSAVIFFEIAGIRNSANTVNLTLTQKPIYCVDTNEKKVAISFDAAWGADNTKKILDILDSYEVHATFFLLVFGLKNILK